MRGVGLKWREVDKYLNKKRCQRCGLKYSKGAPECIHCGHLDDTQLAESKQRLFEQDKSHAKIGRTLLIAAISVGLFVVTFLLALN